MLAFMKQRGIPTEGSGITMTSEVDPERGMVGKVGFELHLPPEFPEKYEQAVVRAVEQCTVKRHLHQPPEFDGEHEPGAPRLTSATGGVRPAAKAPAANADGQGAPCPDAVRDTMVVAEVAPLVSDGAARHRHRHRRVAAVHGRRAALRTRGAGGGLDGGAGTRRPCA